MAFLVLLVFSAAAFADDTSPEIVARYEQILERAPAEGISFDKLIQIYEQGEGLEKLDARWAPLSTQPGEKGAAYSILRGLLADRMGKTDQARTLLTTATQNAATDPHAWLALGDFEAREGRLPQAIDAYQKGLATPVTGGDQLALFRKLGQAQERNLDGPGALATWQKMIAAFPKDAFALEEAGTAELDAEQFDDARKTFQKLVDLAEPNSMNRVQALMRLAGVDDRQGRTQAAVHGYEVILPLTAESSWLNREIRAQIEQVYRREDDLAGLVAYYQKWVQSNPHDVEAILLWSGALSELGHKPEALEALRKAAALAPDRHEVRQTLAERLVDAKQYDEAVQVETALTADDPTEPRYWVTLGEALWNKTQPPTPESKKAVLDAWNHIAPAASKDVAAILQVADLCQSHGWNDEALAGYQRALALTPDATDIREKAAALLVDLHREDEAWKLLDAMVDGPGATAANELKLAQIDERLDRHDAEDAAIARGLALDPKNFDLLAFQWTRLAQDQKWPEAIALFDRLLAAAPNAYFVDLVEGRQVEALASAGKLDEVQKSLQSRLGGQPPLSEAELRLLVRILAHQDDPEIERALAEARQRFPQSPALLQLEVDYDNHAGKSDDAVAGLRRLIALQPQQKEDLLSQIVRIRQDQSNFDEALKTAQEIIDASPASAGGYLLYADVAFAAGKNDDGVNRLRTAIRLSDKPNDVRLRLAHHEEEVGDMVQARKIYDEAFAAASDPQEKVSIVRAMTPVYFQTGQIDELIGRFRQEQNAEDGGWRYGLYLSAIEEQLDDYGAARRELAKSLVARPQDAGLIRSLISLADKEGDMNEVLRYRQMLVSVDPASANQIALAQQYADLNRPADAWNIVQKNQAGLAKDPLAWREVLNAISDPAYAGKIREALQAAIRAQGGTFGGDFALAQFDLQQHDIPAAKKVLWEILSMPLPPEPAKTPANNTLTNGVQMIAGIAVVGGRGGLPAIYQSAAMRRMQNSYVVLNEIGNLLSNQQQNRSGVIRGRMINASAFGGPNVSTVLSPSEIKDHALIYLAAIAVQEKDAANFLQELQKRLAGASLLERLVEYSLVQARGPLLDTIEAQSKSTQPSTELDQMCELLAAQFTQDPASPDGQRAKTAMELLQKRIDAATPPTKKSEALKKLAALSDPEKNKGKEPSPAERKKAIDEYIDALDPKEPSDYFTAIQLAAAQGAWDDVHRIVGLLAKLDRTRWPVGLTQQLSFLPLSILNVQTVPGKMNPPSKEAVGAVLDLFDFQIPSHPPPPVSPANLATQRFMFRGGDAFPPSNRYFSEIQLLYLQQVVSRLKAGGMVGEMEKQLDERIKAASDWRAIYPRLMKIFVQWWSDEKEPATASARALLAAQPSDDFRLLLASMLTQQQKYADALPILDAITARYGPQYIQTQIQLLHTARLADDKATGTRAALRLLALRLPTQQQVQITDDLRAIGMKDKADEIMQRQTRLYNPGQGSMQADMKIVQTMQAASRSGDTSTALDLARQLLNKDPFAGGQFNQSMFPVSAAISTLREHDALGAYLEDLDRQLTATPDSPRLNWIAAQAYRLVSSRTQQTLAYGPLPQWLKLQRTGNHWDASSSLDGKQWTSLGGADLNLPPQVLIGLDIATTQPEPTFRATFDETSITGQVDSAPAPVTNAPAATPPATNSSSTTAPLANPLAPWQEADLGPVKQPGKVTLKDGLFSLTPPLRKEGINPTSATHFVYRTLQGDGILIARVKNLTLGESTFGSEVGLAARSSLDTDAANFTLLFSRGEGLEWRSNPSKDHLQAQPPASAQGGNVTQNKPPLWLKLSRHGHIFDAMLSRDGQTWSLMPGSRFIAIGDNTYIGLIEHTVASTALHTSWSNLHLTGKVDPPPAGNSTPVPWQQAAIEGPASQFTVKIDGSNLTTDTSASSQNTPRTNFLYQTLHGDGEIVAFLDSTGANPGGWSGLTIRDGLTTDVSGITLYCDATNGQAGLLQNSNGNAIALHYFQRVAELRPNDAAVLTRVAQELNNNGQSDAAVAIYLTLLKNNPASALDAAQQMEPAFNKTGHLKELADAIDAWQPPPANLNGVSNNYALPQAGRLFEQDGDLADAERIYRKALTLENLQNHDEVVLNLVRLLITENKRDDAPTELQKGLIDSAQPASAPILGNSALRMQPNMWMFSIGWNQDGPMPSPRLAMIDLAQKLGLLPKLKARYESLAAQDKNPPRINGVDPNQTMLLLIAIAGEEPGVEERVKKAIAGGSPGMNNSLLLLLGALESHPKYNALAFFLVQKLADDSTYAQNANMLVMLDRITYRIASRLNDSAILTKLLKKEQADYAAARAQNPNFVGVEQGLSLVRELIKHHLLKEAAAELVETRAHPQVAANPQYNQPQIDEVQAELDAASGKPADTYDVSYGFIPGENKIFWNLGPTQSRQRDFFASAIPLWLDLGGPHPTKQTLVVQAGAEGKLTPIATFNNVASTGAATIKIPPGATALRAALASDKTPPDREKDLLLAGGKNLLENPAFATPADALQIPGWTGLFPSSIIPVKDTPIPRQSGVTLVVGGNGSQQISSNPVPLASGTTYVFSGWFRSFQGNINLHFLDPAGKVLTSRSLGNPNRLGAAWDFVQERIGPPPNAVSARIEFQAFNRFDLAGLSLRVWPPSAPVHPGSP